ncbi:MAG: Flp family type IVb pilin [Candidatus Thiodiazotropha sp.]
MKNFLMNLWQDESGAETAEWTVIVALILAVGIAVYPGVLQPMLTSVVNGIATTLTTTGGLTLTP